MHIFESGISASNSIISGFEGFIFFSNEFLEILIILFFDEIDTSQNDLLEKREDAVTKLNKAQENEKKAMELMLFSGDIRKYGISKAMTRQEFNNEE